jgi:uncharacterized membrane protein
MTRDERAAIARALADAEDGTTGRIGVRVIPDSRVDAFERAKREFKRARLHRHGYENAAMILVAPKAHRFAIIGDRLLHHRVGDEFWRDVVEQTQPYFSRGAIQEGIVYAVGRIGEALHAHFPQGESDVAP